MNPEKRKLSVKYFFDIQFSECLLIRMLYSRSINNGVANLDKTLSYEEIFLRDDPVSVPPTESRSLREKCPNTEFFLVRIFLYSH